MPAKVFAVAAYLIALAGAGLFLAYVVGAGVGLLPRDQSVDRQLSIQVNFGLLMLFVVPHTAMARQVFKARLGYLGRSIYVATSGLTLGILTWFWQVLPGEPIWDGPLWIVGISLLAVLGVGACSAWFNHASFYGFTQAWTGVAEVHVPLRFEGPYRYVRHPLMLGFLIVIWAQPIMPPELLMLNVGMTLYVLGGITFEEHDLILAYGDQYEQYRRNVPALIPWRGRV
jgi:methanethiol S-methyltransferase